MDSGAWRPVPAPPRHQPTPAQPGQQNHQNQPNQDQQNQGQPGSGYGQPGYGQAAYGQSGHGQAAVDQNQNPDLSGDAALQAADEAVAALEGLAELPVTEHVARFDLAHAALTEALASIDKV